MTLLEEIDSWKNKKVLIIGEALIDKYIFGFADRISPDAPVPNVKVEETQEYLGGIGLTLKFIKNLGGIPKICTIIGNDYEGEFYLKKLKEAEVDPEGIIKDDEIQTPQVTRIKAMHQHLIRLETDYSSQISEEVRTRFLEKIRSQSNDVDSIVILDYGIGAFFQDKFIQTLISNLKKQVPEIPILCRPNIYNYYLYEDVDLIKMNLQKALRGSSIDCCTETSINIVGKKILNSAKCKNVILNDIEATSYLFDKSSESVKKFQSVLKEPVRSYVAIGSILMAILGLSYAAKCSILDSVKISLLGATLEAKLPPIKFFNAQKLKKYVSELMDKNLL